MKYKIFFVKKIITSSITELNKPFKKIINKIAKLKYIKYRKTNNPFISKNKKIGLKVQNQICFFENYESAMDDFSNQTLIYHYQTSESKEKDTYFKETDFNSVIRSLYYFPESFEVPNDAKNEYSIQQLNYLDRLKQELLRSGLKDIYSNNEENLEEYKKRNLENNFYDIKYFNENEKTKLKRIKINIKIIILVIVFFLFTFLSDFISLNINYKPIFMKQIKTIEENYELYYGLFYKAIIYNDNVYIRTYFMKENITSLEKNNIKIIDSTKTCKNKYEKIYEDKKYEYYFICTKSPNVTIIKNNKTYKLDVALSKNIININDLRKKINVLKVPKTIY